MTFTLTIDEPRWEASVRGAAEQFPAVVPVIKGNGYGFGRERLAELSTRLGVDTVAVGTEAEIASVRKAFHGSIAVLGPMTMAEALKSSRPVGSVIRTVAHADVLRHLADQGDPGIQVILELDSPVHRHGVQLAELAGLTEPLSRVHLAGIAMHLPSGGDRQEVVQSVHRAIYELRTARVPVDTFWVSHLTATELAALRAAEPGITVRPRVGTGLWLADRSTFKVTGTVLDARTVPNREAVGYRQRRMHGGTLLVVSGGTAHGIGLQASSGRSGLKNIMKSVVQGAAHGAGWSPSPFRWAGKKLHYADVAHMQVSMLIVPPGVKPPAVGDRLACDVRMTVSTFDEVEMNPARTGEAVGRGATFPAAS
ncbi:alanine racemase [Kineosporia mesophila]|uniref:Alanine racemase n=1 Tax=Kineosporia mesophila TaxID=566012 RepID=A0ABP6ZE73_9ACTN|nr:alanine racemase [Kineosporia mesophila]MCD5354167.1 alanine racemase [Kineosporia mesophila]